MIDYPNTSSNPFLWFTQKRLQTLTTVTNGLHSVTVPLHSSLKAGTLNGILKDIADHLQIGKKELLGKLFE